MSQSPSFGGTAVGLQAGQIVAIVTNNQDFPYVPGEHTIVVGPEQDPPPAGQPDLFAQTGWDAESDPFACVRPSQQVRHVSWLHIPETRRYDVIFTAGVSAATPGSLLAAKVCRNGFDIKSDAIAADIRPVTSPAENWLRAERLAVHLRQDDWLVWSNWGSTSFTCAARLTNIPTQIILRAAAE